MNMAEKSTTAPAVLAQDCPCCDNEATKLCSGCKDIAYCSTTCQKADWRFHKHLCKTLDRFRERPAPNMRRALYFPPDAEKPTFRWLEVHDVEGQDGLYKDLRVEGTDLEKAWIPVLCSINVRTRQLLPQTISLRYDPELDEEHVSSNAALITATNGRRAYNWKGPIIACPGVDTRDGPFTDIKDFSLSQYSALIAFLTKYDFSSAVEDDFECLTRELRMPKVDAVKVFAGHDGSVDTMHSIEISGAHPAFLARWGAMANFTSRGYKNLFIHSNAPGEFSPISTRIETPVIAWKAPTESIGPQYVAKSIAPMFIDITEDVAAFGATPPTWNQVCTHILLTSYGDAKARNLDVDTAAAFAAYCQHHVRPFVQWALKIRKSDRLPRIKRVLEEITPAKWAVYKSQHLKMLDESNEVKADTVGGAPRMGLTKVDASKVVARFLGTQLPDITSLSFV